MKDIKSWGLKKLSNSLINKTEVYLMDGLQSHNIKEIIIGGA